MFFIILSIYMLIFKENIIFLKIKKNGKNIFFLKWDQKR